MSENPQGSFSVGEVTRDWASTQGLSVWFREQTPSTNDTAKSESGSAPTAHELYLTGDQTHGRGRGANLWQNGQSGGQLFSTWRFEFSAAPQALTGPRFGLAVFRACQALWPNQAWSIKAPNDLYLSDKKVLGLLVEAVSLAQSTQLLVGIGMNVFSAPEGVEEAGAITEVFEKTETPWKDQWWNFLSHLQRELKQAAERSTLTSLDSTECNSLLSALNTWPGLNEPYTEVESDGSLRTASKKIHWQEL